MTEMI